MGEMMPAQQGSQGKGDILSSWFRELVEQIDTQLNWLDLVAFGLGALALLVILFILLRRRKKQHIEEIEHITHLYEEEMHEIKERHLAEIVRTERSIETYRKRLNGIEAEYDENLKWSETQFSKRVQQLEKTHAEILSSDEITLFELKQEIKRLRSIQLKEVNAFEQEIERLKDEIHNVHEKHAKEIELAASEIANLRKQMQTLMYKV